VEQYKEERQDIFNKIFKILNMDLVNSIFHFIGLIKILKFKIKYMNWNQKLKNILFIQLDML